MPIFLAALVVFSALSFGQAAPPWQAPLTDRKWAEAETLLKQALSAGESAPVLSGLALVYRATGRVQDAEPVLERLVALDESAANVEELARVKAALGDLDRSEALYRRAVELRSDADGAASVIVHQRLAEVLLAEKKFPDAEQEASVAVSIRTRAAGPKDERLAGDNAVLARIYEAQKKWERAAGVWETVAGIQADTQGYDNLRLADTLDSLASCRLQLGQPDPAEEALRRALAIRELNLGPASADVGHTADQLGMLLFRTKRFGDAESFFRRALDIFLALDAGEPILAQSYDNLAVTEAMLEKYDEAERLYREALKLRDAQDVLSLRNLALILVQRQKLAEAEPLYSRALANLDSPANANPELLKQVVGEYASLLRDLKRPAEAVRLEARLKAKQAPQGKRVSQDKQAADEAKQ